MQKVLAKCFLLHTKELRCNPERPVVLFFDGHYSHVCLELAMKAAENNVILFCLPPSTTDKLQPLDVAVFSSFKRAWGKILKERKLKTGGALLRKEDFPGILKQFWETRLKPENFVAGFRATGIYPLKKGNSGKESKLAVGFPFQTDASNEEEVSATSETANPSINCLHLQLAKS